MSPLRWDVLGVGFLLAVPVLALGVRGDFTWEEVTTRLPWCLLAGWLVVALVKFASTPRTTSAAPAKHAAEPRSAPEPESTDQEPAPTP
jgi:hypothetical protein